MKFTYTSYSEWDQGGHRLPGIPKSIEKQNELLSHAVYELIDALMDELGWDNPDSVCDRLSDQVNRIASKSYSRWADAE